MSTVDLGTLSGSVIIFGGPYSNLAATEAMRQRARQLGVANSHIICTGDVVAYCADAEATTQLVRNWGIPVVMGNCEESLGEQADDCGCGFDEGSACSLLSVGWYNYATRQISDNSRQWMRTLPRQILFAFAGKTFLCIHGGVDKINQFVFASTPVDEKRTQFTAAKMIAAQTGHSQIDAIVGGHCGIPFGEKVDQQLWLNAGVIGMPANDGTADGWFMQLTEQSGGVLVEWHRLTYPVEASQLAMQKAGLNTPYQQALATGLWPSLDVLPGIEKKATGKCLAMECVWHQCF